MDKGEQQDKTGAAKEETEEFLGELVRARKQQAEAMGLLEATVGKAAEVKQHLQQKLKRNRDWETVRLDAVRDRSRFLQDLIKKDEFEMDKSS